MSHKYDGSILLLERFISEQTKECQGALPINWRFLKSIKLISKDFAISTRFVASLALKFPLYSNVVIRAYGRSIGKKSFNQSIFLMVPDSTTFERDAFFTLKGVKSVGFAGHDQVSRELAPRP